MPRSDYYALVIGIARYPNLCDLQGPIRDAKSFCKWLLVSGEVPSTNLFVVAGNDVIGGVRPATAPDPLQGRQDRGLVEQQVDDLFVRAVGQLPQAGERPD